MRRRFPMLLATALSASVISITHAAEADDAVRTSGTPYKPGREISGGVAGAAEDGAESVKHANAPYKPGREIESDQSSERGGPDSSPDEGAETLKPDHPPYRPGRQANDR